MPCDDKKQAFETAMVEAQKRLTAELKQVADDAEAKAAALSTEFENGNDLATGVGAAAGTVLGGIVGGVGGAVVGEEIGKQLGKLFLLKVQMVETKAILDLPEVTLKRQEWKFDVPSVTMRDKVSGVNKKYRLTTIGITGSGSPDC